MPVELHKTYLCPVLRSVCWVVLFSRELPRGRRITLRRRAALGPSSGTTRRESVASRV